MKRIKIFVILTYKFYIYLYLKGYYENKIVIRPHKTNY